MNYKGKSKYAVKCYAALVAAAERGADIPPLRVLAKIAGCPPTGRGRMSQTIKDLERDGYIRRVIEAGPGVGVTVQIVITATGLATKRREPRTISQDREVLVRSAKALRIARAAKKVAAKLAKESQAKPESKPEPKLVRLIANRARREHLKVIGHFASCQWLEKEPKDRNFCGVKTLPGSPWCGRHHARCYGATFRDSAKFTAEAAAVAWGAKVA